MGDLFLIGIGIIICILFKKYDDNQKMKIQLAMDKAAKRKSKPSEVEELREQVEELTRIVRESKKSSE
jgi:type VI protein secretion system component VasK